MTNVRPADRSTVPLLNERGSQTIDALFKAAGRSSDDALATKRAAHAFGSFASGYFTPSTEAHEVFASALFDPAPAQATKVIVRFSPFAADKRNDSVGPYGLALRLSRAGDTASTADDTETTELDILTLNLSHFVASNREDFLAFTASIKSPHKVLPLLLSPRLSLSSLAPIAGSKLPPHKKRYTDHVWNSQNTFWVTNRDGLRTPVRHRFRAAHSTNHEKVSGSPKADRLDRQLASDLSGERTLDIIWEVVDGSSVPLERLNDATKPFPKRSPTHRMGTITLDTHKGTDDSNQALDAIGFNPLNLCDGIIASDDPLLTARGAAMPESQVRRGAARDRRQR